MYIYIYIYIYIHIYIYINMCMYIHIYIHQQVKKSGLTEGLAFTFRQLNKGGGPSKMRDRYMFLMVSLGI
jgi:hypothetical protein